MNQDKWISVDKKSQNFVLRFRVKGFTNQFFISSGLADTPINRELVKLKRDALLVDIQLEIFDSSLKSYQFKADRNSRSRITTNASKNYDCDLQYLWKKFTEFKETILEQTTILTKYRQVEIIVNRLPNTSLTKASQIREWLLKNTCHHTAWTTLIMFSACCDWAIDTGLIPDNPFLKLKIRKPKKRFDTQENYQAFTLKQRDIIIDAFENHPLHSHYASLIKFLFWTGARPGEAFALTWADITDNCTRIRIDKSCNNHRIKKGTKNNKKRIFPTTEGSKLQQMLLNLKSQGEYNPNSLVFVSKTGRPLCTKLLFTVWNKNQKTSKKGVRTSSLGVVASLASKGLVPYLKVYATRHTFCTWAITNGITADKVALWVGDEVQTILDNYVHPNVVGSECPDF